jgi:hypothetical protein
MFCAVAESRLTAPSILSITWLLLLAVLESDWLCVKARVAAVLVFDVAVLLVLCVLEAFFVDDEEFVLVLLEDEACCWL